MPDTADPMWMDRISLAPRSATRAYVSANAPGLGCDVDTAGVPLFEAGIELVGVQVDALGELLAVDGDRERHDLDAVPLGQRRRELGVRVGDDPDHSSASLAGSPAPLATAARMGDVTHERLRGPSWQAPDEVVRPER